MFNFVLFCSATVILVTAALSDDVVSKLQSSMVIQPDCNGELGNPTVGNGLRRRQRLTVCYCDSEMYKNDPTGCQMVCSGGMNSSTDSYQCDCVTDLETCRQWLCRLGNGDSLRLYCRAINQALVPCRHVDLSSPTDFDECQCGNNGWRNKDGFCTCTANFNGILCEHESGAPKKTRVNRDSWSKYRSWLAWIGQQAAKGNFEAVREAENDPMKSFPLTQRRRLNNDGGSSYGDSNWGSSWSSNDWSSGSSRSSSDWSSGGSSSDGSNRNNDRRDGNEQTSDPIYEQMVRLVLILTAVAVVMIACCVIGVWCKNKHRSRNSATSYSAVTDAWTRTEPVSEPMVDVRAAVDETGVGNMFAYGADTPVYPFPPAGSTMNTANPLPNAPQADETSPDAAHSDQPPPYSKAVAVIGPPPLQSDEALPSYHDVVNKKSAPIESLDNL